MAATEVLSSAVAHLDPDSRVRYIQKLALAGVSDPYDIPTNLFIAIDRHARFDDKTLPQLSYIDIANYLVFSTSYYTSANMKAFKSLEAYKYFVAGWVHGLQTWSIPGKQRVLVMAKVCHSQRLGDPPLRPWISIKLDGEVVCAHCTCMAGVGEACSHIGATLFALETSIMLLKNTACTSMPCEWIRPSAQKIEYAEGASIKFVSPRRKFNEVRCESLGSERTQRRPTSASLVPPTSSEATGFYASLAASGSRCSVLSMVSPYCEAYIPRAVTHKLPQPLPDALLDDNYVLTSDFAVLETKCAAVFASMSLTADEAVAIECETRGQASSSAWFRYRAGRVTASNFKAAARTQAANPGNLSRSLIKRICYPSTVKFSTAATRWGCEHETGAVTAYEAIIKSSHTNVSVSHSPGLHINRSYPHLGASPDAIIDCSCHGRGIVEVKCPYCKRDSTMDDAADDPKFCLQKNSEGVLCLKSTRQYYYQVQAQLFVSGLPYCDFVVFSGSNNIFVQRIIPDAEFWGAANIHVKQFCLWNTARTDREVVHATECSY